MKSRRARGTHAKGETRLALLAQIGELARRLILYITEVSYFRGELSSKALVLAFALW